jgi:dsDNA-specific endonuclease/ATPase MutS2
LDSHTFAVLEFEQVKNLISGFAGWEGGKKEIANLLPFKSLASLKNRQEEVKEGIKLISEDEEYNAGIDIQELTDQYIKKIDEAIRIKEIEIMEDADVLRIQGIITLREEVEAALAHCDEPNYVRVPASLCDALRYVEAKRDLKTRILTGLLFCIAAILLTAGI